MQEAPRLHSFTQLTLTIHEVALVGVRTDHRFELRSAPGGAEVWRSSTITGPHGSVDAEWRYIGALSSRRVIELLEEIRRSGLYDALPALGIVDGDVDPATRPRVSMTLTGSNDQRNLLDEAPQDVSLVADLVRTIRAAIEQAQENALTASG